MKIIVINGPNLNLLGEREPDVYGSQTLNDLEKLMNGTAKNIGNRLSKSIDLVFFQSNHEGEIIDFIHQMRLESDGLIINAGGLTHTSVALHDALAAYPPPKMEVHISNPHAREEYRHHSYLSSVVKGVICGCGLQGYCFALEALCI